MLVDQIRRKSPRAQQSSQELAGRQRGFQCLIRSDRSHNPIVSKIPNSLGHHEKSRNFYDCAMPCAGCPGGLVDGDLAELTVYLRDRQSVVRSRASRMSGLTPFRIRSCCGARSERRILRNEGVMKACETLIPPFRAAVAEPSRVSERNDRVA
jgi:hypothetical protein